MTTSANTTTHAPILKSLYGNDVAIPLYKQSSLIAKCKKDTRFTGKNHQIDVAVTGPRGAASSYAAAIAQKQASSTVAFVMTRKKMYKVIELDGELIEAAKMTGKGAIVDGLKYEMDLARKDFFNDLSLKVWGLGGGARGRVANTVFTGQTVTLTNRSDIVNIEKNMKLGFASDNGTGSSLAGLRGDPTYVTVASVDRDAGTFTISESALNTVNSIANNDYIFMQGDYGVCITGLQGWVPTATPDSTSFFGVDRSVDPLRLAGVKYTAGAGDSKESILIDATAEGEVNSVNVTAGWMNPLDFRHLLKELGSTRVINETAMDGKVSFKAVELLTSSGALPVMVDKHCPQGFGYFFDPSEFCLYSLGPVPNTLDHGSGTKGMVLSSSADALEIRLGMYGQTYHSNPGNSIVVQF